jgi:hypothetical protein
VSLTPPTDTRAQKPAIRLQQRTNPLIRHSAALQLAIALQKRRGAEQGRLEVDIHRLPHASVGLEDLVVDAHVVVLLERALPPLPGLAVQRRARVGVHVVDAAPVADVDEFVGAVGVLAVELRLSEDCVIVSVTFGENGKMIEW